MHRNEIENKIIKSYYLYSHAKFILFFFSNDLLKFLSVSIVLS